VLIPVSRQSACRQY